MDYVYHSTVPSIVRANTALGSRSGTWGGICCMRQAGYKYSTASITRAASALGVKITGTWALSKTSMRHACPTTAQLPIHQFVSNARLTLFYHPKGHVWQCIANCTIPMAHAHTAYILFLPASSGVYYLAHVKSTVCPSSSAPTATPSID